MQLLSPEASSTDNRTKLAVLQDAPGKTTLNLWGRVVDEDQGRHLNPTVAIPVPVLGKGKGRKHRSGECVYFL